MWRRDSVTTDPSLSKLRRFRTFSVESDGGAGSPSSLDSPGTPASGRRVQLKIRGGRVATPPDTHNVSITLLWCYVLRYFSSFDIIFLYFYNCRHMFRPIGYKTYNVLRVIIFHILTNDVFITKPSLVYLSALKIFKFVCLLLRVSEANVVRISSHIWVSSTTFKLL